MKEYHIIKEECDCEIGEIVIADENGEDCIAYEELNKLKIMAEKCKRCGKLPVYTLTK